MINQKSRFEHTKHDFKVYIYSILIPFGWFYSRLSCNVIESIWLFYIIISQD